MVVLSELQPGSSSSSHDLTCRYDVFLSFRGSDTRRSFTDHLYNALLDADINTFLDDEEIEAGEALKPDLESAIKSSRASIIVLSKNYASSTWCLDELVLILEQQKNFNQIVIPIFYHVEPIDVQQSSFGEAMAEHKGRMEAETNPEKRREWAQRMDLWKMALTNVTGLKGKVAKGRRETEFIKEVVTDINRRLGSPLSTNLPRLIGMDHYIRLISSWLTNGSLLTSDVLAVVGMGGIGKTSLAKYAFQLHCGNFYGSSFIEDIGIKCNAKDSGLLDLQKQLHRDISKKISSTANDVSLYTSKIEKALAHKLVFVVLDGVDSLHQLDALLGNKGLHPGSKIIVTTKDESLTERCALLNGQAHRGRNHRQQVLLNGLYHSESLELLCIHAFNSQIPKEGYNEVSEKLVKYCSGHPLALEVLGRSLHNLDVGEWEEYIKILRKEPHSYIKSNLKMSFDLLPSINDKELFKHIACFFVGKDKDLTETILNACGINTKSGITSLVDTHLLSIQGNNKLGMHSLIQEMGRDLVRQECPDKPWKRSRLWCHEESLEVLKYQNGKKNLLGLALDMRMLNKNRLCGPFELKTESLTMMDNLMLLQLNYVPLTGSYKNFPEELRWLCMHGFPLKSIPSDLPMKNLVALDMSYSNIESFDVFYTNPKPHAKRQKELVGSYSKDKPLLGLLKILDLSFSKQLLSVGGFSELPALERLILRKCISLVEVCESVEQCVELVHIDLSYCSKLKKFPTSIGKLKKVKTLLLDIGINSQTSSHAIMPSDSKLIAISLPRSLRYLSLANSNLSNESFPMELSCLSMLEELYLDNNLIVSMPDFVRSLPRLERLSLNDCDKLISIEHPPLTLTELSISGRPLHDYSLRKIKFDQKMSPLERLIVGRKLPPHSSIEIDGMVKIQPMVGVEEKLLHSLGWTNMDFIKERRFETNSLIERLEESQTQMYYDFGIFNTFYEGERIPDWIRGRSKGPLISFTIPSSPKKLRGLNFCCVETISQDSFVLPVIKISNITKNHTWIYDHYIQRVSLGGKCLSLLSHWMFGSSEMKSGDHITISVGHIDDGDHQLTLECGFGLVYDDGRKTEEEDVLGYYKSWNHIIGGDLSAFQLTTGEYTLGNSHFMRHSSKIGSPYLPFIDEEASYKEEEVRFKAFSQRSLK